MDDSRHFMNPAMGRHLGASPAPNDPGKEPLKNDNEPLDVEGLARALADCVREFLSKQPEGHNDGGDDGGAEDLEY